MAMKEMPTKRRQQTRPDPIWISGEITTVPKAAAKLGMSNDWFSRKRRKLVSQLAPGEVLTWEHFTKVDASNESDDPDRNP